MLATTERRYIAVGITLSMLFLTTLAVPYVGLFALAALGLVGVVALALWLYDWCLQADEDIEASRIERDREHARQ